MTHPGLDALPFFNEAAIAEVLTWPPLIDAIENAMISLSAGEVEQPVRQMVPVPGHDAIIAAILVTVVWAADAPIQRWLESRKERSVRQPSAA